MSGPDPDLVSDSMAKAPKTLSDEMQEIAEGRRAFPRTAARRHHFVPSFHLARFGEPAGRRKGLLFQLDHRTGKPQRTTPDSACFARDLYTAPTETGEPDNWIEAFLSIFERHTAPAISRFVADPANQTSDDREAMAWYLAFLSLRTPPMLAQIEDLSRVLMESMFAVKFSDPVSFAGTYREALQDDASDEEIERMRQRMLAQLQAGDVSHADPNAESLRVMLEQSSSLAETIHQMQWCVLEAAEDEFITSDRGIAMHDPTLRFPWEGHAWKSSDDAQTLIPLDPAHCLLIEPGPPRSGRATVGARDMEAINLGIYGWANRFIYGHSQATVQAVRTAAKRHPKLVIRPRITKMVMFELADPDDPAVGLEHARQGLPRGAWIKDPQGVPRFCTYHVLEPGAPRGSSAAIGAGIGQRVIEQAVRDGHRTPVGPEIHFFDPER